MKKPASRALETPMNLHSPASRAIAWAVSAALILNPMGSALAQITVASGATTVGTAGNGVPIVNIAAPNAKGLSHNRFTDYNVGSSGLILNNATTAWQNTQLGGHIVGNPNLNGQAAGLILNEVTGGRPSQLRGYTEIAGQAARLVVANPWGIACNGCGFLNTPRVTLTTGTPRIEDGRLAGFRVEGGEIAIEGAGLNAGNIDQFDLVTRSAKINAAIYAQRLNVVTGRNDVNADDLSATALAADGNAPLLAIDSAMLGGMYANSIMLLGTEGGVGVRLAGDMAATAGDIRIDTAGRLTVTDAAAAGRITARAASLETQGQLYAGSQLELTATGDLANQSTLAARDAVVLNSGGTLTNQGHVEAGVNPDDSRNAGGDIRVAGQTVRNSGSMLASRDLQVSDAQALDNRGGQLVAARHLMLAAGKIDNRGGEISAQDSASVQAQRLDNSDAGQLLAADLTLNTLHLLNLNKGLIYGWDATRVTGARLDNSGGTLASDESLTVALTARPNDTQLDGSLSNAGGLVSSEGTLTLSAVRIDNRAGNLSSAGKLRLDAGGALLNQDGDILTDADLWLRSASLDNRQGQISAVGALDLGTGAFDNTEGFLTAKGRLDLAAGQVTNGAGRIASAGALVVSATGLAQQGGELFSQSTLSLDLHGGALNNDGAFINAPGALVLKSLGAVSNRGGEISSAESFALAADSLDNSAGRLLSEQDLTVDIDGALDNRDGTLAGQRLDLAAASLDNGGGLIHSRDDLTAAIGELSQADGELLAEGDLTLTGQKLDNRGGLIAANGALQLAVDEIDNRGGEISTQAAATLQAQRLDNSDAGQLLAADLTLNTLHLLNLNKGLIYGWDATRVTGARLDNSGGTLASDESLTVALTARADNAQLDGSLNNRGGLINSEGTLTLSAVQIDNQEGMLSSAGDLGITAGGALLNQDGDILTDAALWLRSASLDNRQGQISAVGALDLGTGTFDNTEGFLTAKGRLDLAAGQVTNGAGRIASTGALVVNATGLAQQGGELFSQSTLSLDLNKGALNNDGGFISAPDALVLNNLGGVSNRGGEISSAKGFALTATSLDNTDGLVLSDADLVLRVERIVSDLLDPSSTNDPDAETPRFDNIGGTLHAKGNLGLTVAGALDNSGEGLIQAGKGLSLDAGSIDNRGGYLLAGESLGLTVAETLDNRDAGLINSQGGLELSAAQLDSSTGGEVSAKGDMQLTLDTLVQRQGVLIGEGALGLTLGKGGLDNYGGLISSNGALALTSLGALDNRSGEISSLGALVLNAVSLDNGAGRIISHDRLKLLLGSEDPLPAGDDDALLPGSADNRGGLLSGWKGLVLTAASLDNRQLGTLSSRDGDLAVQLEGELLNSGKGALVAAGRLDLAAESLDNREGGILSSGGGQSLTLADTLKNQGGQIDSGAALDIEAASLDNRGGLVLATQALKVSGGGVANAAGQISAGAAADFELGGGFGNVGGQLVSVGPLSLTAETVDNRGGTLASRDTLSIKATSLDNSASPDDPDDPDDAVGGTLAANGALTLTVTGAVDNRGDGLIYSGDATLALTAAALDNQGGTLQSKGTLSLVLGGDLLNAGGTVVSRAGDVDAKARNLDNRQGTLASVEGLVQAVLSGWLNNGAIGEGAGGLIQGKRLALAAAGALTNAGGRIHALDGAATLSAASLDNQGGVLYAKLKLGFTGASLDNRQGKIGAGEVGLTLSGALDNRQGVIESGSTLAVSGASLDNQGGQLRALGSSGTTAFQLGGLLDNRNGVLETANDNLTLAVGSLSNEGGTVLHAGDGEFGIAAAQAGGAGGSLVTQGGLTLTAGTWSNSSVIQAARLTLNVGTLAQTTTGKLLATESFTGSGGNWTNDGLIASDGTLSLTLTGGYGGNGRLTSLGTLSLAAASLDLASTATIAAGEDGAVLTLSGQATNRGRITAAGDLTVSAATLNNYGTLGSAKRLTLTTPTLLNETGLIFSGGDMAMRVGSFINRHADVYSLDGLLIGGLDDNGSAGTVENHSGAIESVGDMGIRAQSFKNWADIVEENRRLTSGYVAVRCYDCDNDHYTVDYFVRENYESEIQAEAPASITSGGNFNFAGTTFTNQLSTIAAAGDISIETGQFSNEGALSGTIERTRVYNMTEVTDGTVKRFVEAYVLPYNQRNNPEFPNVYYVNFAGEIRLAEVLVPEVPSNGEDVSFAFIEYRDVETGQRVGNFLTGLPIIVTGGSDYQLPQSQYDPNNLLDLPAIYDALPLVSDLEVSTGGGSGQSAVIQAGGNVSIAASQNLNNGVIYHDYTHQQGNQPSVDTSSVQSVTTTVVQLNAQLPPDLAQQQVNPLTLPGFSLPTGQNGLFRVSGAAGSETEVRDAGSGQGWTLSGATLEQAQRESSLPGVQAGDVRLGDLALGARQVQSGDREAASGLPTAQAGSGLPVARVQGVPVDIDSQPHKYVVETNPALTNLTNFLSSDYLLGLLGENVDTAQRRLGDGLYEQRLIREAVVARTGQRYLAGLNSDEAMFRYLMDNAIASKEALNLSVGVSLTAEQVAALTHDIVWLESYELNGEEVLVPVLYLAQGEGRLGPTGALIQGRDVTLIAGDVLANQGTLRATGSLSATATTVVNAGLMEADERLSILALDSVINTRGGIIAGRDVDLTALTGDIINERTVTRFDGRASGFTYTHSLVDAASRIEALGSLSLSAGRDLYNVGSVLSAGTDLSLAAGRNLVIAAAEDSRSSFMWNKRSTFSSAGVTQLGSEVSAGGSLSMLAGNDLAVIASRVDVGRDATLLAGRDLTLAAAADLSHTEYHYRSGSKKIDAETLTVRQQATELAAGGDLVLGAGRDLTLVASAASAGEEAYLYAGGKAALLAAADQNYDFYEKKKKGSWGSKQTQRDEETTATQVGSHVEAGTDLTIESGGDQTYQVASLKSGADLTLDSGGEIAFEGKKDLEQSSHESSNSDWAGFSASGKGKTDETLRQSELVAGGELAIRAAGKIRIDIPEVNKQTVSETISALVEAEPQLAWLKEMEQRGDIDWQRVKEIHDQWDYEQSGVGAVLAIVIAIVVAVVTYGAASSAVGTAAAGTSGTATAGTAAVGTATTTTAAGASSIWAAGTATSAAGWANAAVSAGLAGMASNTAVQVATTGSVDWNQVFKTGAVSALTAGLSNYGFFEGGQSLNSLAGISAAPAGATGVSNATGGLSFSWDQVAGVVGRGVVNAGVSSAIQGSDFGEGFVSSVVGDYASLAAYSIGDAWGTPVTRDASGNLVRNEAYSPALQTVAHAGLGAASAWLTGEDPASGALGGVAGSLIGNVVTDVPGTPGYQALYQGGTALVTGLLAQGLGLDPAVSANTAQNAAINNHLVHEEFARRMLEETLQYCTGAGMALCSISGLSQEQIRALTVDGMLDVLKRGAADHGLSAKDVASPEVAFMNMLFEIIPGLSNGNTSGLGSDLATVIVGEGNPLFGPTPTEAKPIQTEQSVVQTVGGAAQAAAGLALTPSCATGVGCVADGWLFVSGMDNFVTGLSSLTTRETQSTMASQLMMDGGMSPDAARWLEMGVNLGAAGVAGWYTVKPQSSHVTNGTSIATPYGPAIQSSSPQALSAIYQVENGATLYRLGTLGRSQAAEAQFWSLQNPLTTPNYSSLYGIPAENVVNANFLEMATLKPGTPFITRPAPGVGANSGGGIEVVVPSGGIQMKFFGAPGSN